jgi:hypothetical protein
MLIVMKEPEPIRMPMLIVVDDGNCVDVNVHGAGNGEDGDGGILMMPKFMVMTPVMVRMALVMA